MEIHVLTWIIDIFFIFTLHILAKKVLGVKAKNKIVLVLGWCGYFIGWNLLSYLFAEIPLINGIGSFSAIMAVLSILYEGRLQNKIIMAFSIVILGIIAEAIVGFLFILLGVDMNNNGMIRADYVYIGSAISKLVNFVFVKIIVIISQVTKHAKIRMTEWAEIFIVPIGSLIICYVVAWDNNFLITMPEVVTFAILLLINILSYYVYQKVQTQTEEMMHNQMLLQQSEYYKARYEDTEKQWTTLKKIRHDMKNNYVLHMTYLENEQYEKLKESYKNVLGELSSESNIIHTGNIGIDSIVNFKAEIAKEYNIVINQKVEVIDEIRTDSGDMNVLFGNMLDNAIEAVMKLQEKDRYINLKILADETAILVEIGNPFNGTIKKDKNGRFDTIKENKDRHGMGIKIMEKVVKKYNGVFEINTEHQYFSVKAFLYYLED